VTFKRISQRLKILSISIVATILIILWLFLSPSRSMTWAYPDSQFYAATLLRGDAQFSEIAQDAYGFRAMIFRLNAYLPLDQALTNIHENWDLPTTHPPTAFFFAAPVAFLSDAGAATVWAWFSLLALLFSLRLHEFSWREAILFTLLSLLWLPTMGSLGQLTPIWLLSLSLAYYYRERNSMLCGIFIALASMTKFLPALLLFPLMIKRKWAGLTSFLLAWGIALLILFLHSPNIFNQYFQANLIASPYFLVKSGGFLLSAYFKFGLIGFTIVLVFLLLIILNNWREILHSKDITAKTWMIFSFLAVALLPICWGYSYFPLYPGLLLLSKEKKPARIFGVTGLIFTSIIPTAGMVFFGLGLAWPNNIEDAAAKVKSCLKKASDFRHKISYIFPPF
jgi:hypothetical protein